MTLDARLALVAALVPPDSRVADVGTDHARLPIALVTAGRCPAAVATDIHEGPWRRAIEAVAAAGLADRIAVRRGDGLAPVQPPEADTIVIAGLGGETIAAILAAAPWTAAPSKTLLLQPMSKPERLRAWLSAAGFALAEERLAADGGRLYTVLRARHDPQRAAAQAARPAFAYAGALTPDEGRPYWDRVAARLRTEAAALPAARRDEAARLRALAAALDTWPH